MSSTVRRLVAASLSTAAVATGAVALTAPASAIPVPDAAAARPVLKVPFPCHEVWKGSTYSGHHLPNAVDINLYSGGDTDEGRTVKSSGAGTVEAAGNVGAGYGNRVIIKHSGEYRTLYAHLKTINVSPGQSVSASTTVGTVGKSGGQEYTHLHYEQRLGTNDIKIRFGQTQDLVYYDNDQRLERTSC